MKYLVNILMAVVVAASVAMAGLELEDTTSTTNGATSYTIPINFLDWYKLSSVLIQHEVAGVYTVAVEIVRGGPVTNRVLTSATSATSNGSVWIVDGDLWVKTVVGGTNTIITTTSSGTNYTATIQLSK
jgi:hypothetical protein